MLRARDGMLLVAALHRAGGDSYTNKILAEGIRDIALARTDEGRGFGAKVDAVLASVLERLTAEEAELTGAGAAEPVEHIDLKAALAATDPKGAKK